MPAKFSLEHGHRPYSSQCSRVSRLIKCLSEPSRHRVQRRCVCRQNIKARRKPPKKWVILFALQFRYTFYRPQTKRLRARKIGLQSFLLLGTSCLGRPSVTLRATCRTPARIWLADIDFQKSIIVYSRFIKCHWAN